MSPTTEKVSKFHSLTVCVQDELLYKTFFFGKELIRSDGLLYHFIEGVDRTDRAKPAWLSTKFKRYPIKRAELFDLV